MQKKKKLRNYVLCSICESKIKVGQGGQAQQRIYMLPDGTQKVIRKYMCAMCRRENKPWPGWKPGPGIPLSEIK